MAKKIRINKRPIANYNDIGKGEKKTLQQTLDAGKQGKKENETFVQKHAIPKSQITLKNRVEVKKTEIAKGQPAKEPTQEKSKGKQNEIEHDKE